MTTSTAEYEYEYDDEYDLSDITTHHHQELTMSAWILSAIRTPIGRFGGVFKEMTAPQLGAAAVAEALLLSGATGRDVDEVILGNVIQAGQGQNPARQASRLASIPDTVPASTINMVCASGLRSVAMAAQAIRLAESDLIVAGGIESMSHAPFLIPSARWGKRLGHGVMVDAMLHDGLLDAFSGEHMGAIAEHWSARYGITRTMQDEFAYHSQANYKAAVERRAICDEIVPVKIQRKDGQTEAIDADEHPRPETTLEKLATLQPAFSADGTITPGNAAGLNDGAAALVVASDEQAKRLEAEPIARILSYAWSALEPHEFGIAPAGAIRRALSLAGISLDDIDLIECNEAFAVQVLALTREVGWDLDKVNVNGGAIALGHPIGCSGARVLVTLVHEMRRREVRYGLATLCAGGGMGITMVVERSSGDSLGGRKE